MKPASHVIKRRWRGVFHHSDLTMNTMKVGINDVLRYIHYGCGVHAPHTWTNFDSSPTLRLQKIPIIGGRLTSRNVQFPSHVRYGDIVKGLPVKSRSCKGIYCSHVLQHLALEECRTALKNTRDYLEDGGMFRLVVPDLKKLVNGYLGTKSPDAAHKFLKATRLGRVSVPSSILGNIIYNLGRTGKHLWMWDHEAMIHELEAAGFKSIRVAHFGDSSDSRFVEVEEESRWEWAVGIECIQY